MKEKIIKLYEEGLSSYEIARQLPISSSYARRIVRNYKAYDTKFGKHCSERGIELEKVNQYWDKTNQYSVQVKPNYEQDFDAIEEINTLLENYIPNGNKVKVKPNKSKQIAQFFYTDAHVGMNPNAEEKSLYGGSWGEKDLFARLEIVKQQLLLNVPKEVDCLQILNLGDFADGLDKKTVRRQHDLPQNMTNTEVFDVGVRFKIELLEFIYSNFSFNRLVWYNVCNSNHSSDFDYFICQAFKGISKHYEKIEVINNREFMGHIIHGKHCEIISHGKDDVNLKFGFKATLDEKAYKKIDEYIKHYKLSKYIITFHKGDSHLRVDDKTNQDFNYCSYYAFSPSSSWVQVNFQKGRSGFTIRLKYVDKRSGEIVKDFEFKWNSNKLN